MRGIAAVSYAQGRIDIFWPDNNLSMLHNSWNGTAWTTFSQLGGIFTSVPAAVASFARPPVVTEPRAVIPSAIFLTPRIDVFGLGLDYAMYHKTLWSGVADPQWQNLGGIFTSAPATVAWNNGRIDVFGLGLDRAMYHKTWNGNAWSADWERLGGVFSSEAHAISWGPGRLDVFVRGADYTLRHRSHNGSNWSSDWQNLGGSLASPPTAVSWGPNRLDVFAMGTDGELWHRWWDGDIWNDWESLPLPPGTPKFASAPSAVAWGLNRLEVFAVGTDGVVRHLSWANDTWANWLDLGGSMTSAPTAIVVAPNRLDIFAPGKDQNLYHRSWNGVTWTPAGWEQLGGHIKLPTRYRFSVDFVTVDTARSFNNDTDSGQCSIRVGDWPIQTVTQSMGDLGGTAPKQAQTNLLNFEPVAVDLCEPVVFNFSIMNNGHADQATLDAFLTKAGEQLFESLTGIDGPLVEFLLDQFFNVVFADCDGWVAVDQHSFMGRDVHLKTANGPYIVTKTYAGYDSPHGCGDNSQYEVIWSIRRA
jgi:hypothetical protein